ncbi:MAG: hypothetical protein GWN07_06300, partial [Actinobacteria bacterium]|nr:hypothetical protein [Actinomycetota bacterium]NIU65103.1 hypothetical protein [Actinomycetota bacterium]NIW26907.1 hypothetical protein [Actinomycetota bacterium]NIX19459.1 hypothetical protein [Actinomycetota bacterium]
ELGRPEPGEVVVLSAEAGQRYIVNFDPAAAQVTVEGDNLVLLFADGGRIVIQGLGELAGAPDAPTFSIAGTEIAGGTLFAQAGALAAAEAGPEAAATLETAAAPAGPTSGGVGDYREDFDDLITLPDAQGVIPPVEMEFGLIELEPTEVLGEEEEAPAPVTEAVSFIHDETPGVQPDGSDPGPADDVAGLSANAQNAVDGVFDLFTIPGPAPIGQAVDTVSVSGASSL